MRRYTPFNLIYRSEFIIFSLILFIMLIHHDIAYFRTLYCAENCNGDHLDCKQYDDFISTKIRDRNIKLMRFVVADVAEKARSITKECKIPLTSHWRISQKSVKYNPYLEFVSMMDNVLNLMDFIGKEWHPEMDSPEYREDFLSVFYRFINGLSYWDNDNVRFRPDGGIIGIPSFVDEHYFYSD